MPTDCLARGLWELRIGWHAPRTPSQATIAQTPGYPRSPRPERQAIGRRIHFAVVFGSLVNYWGNLQNNKGLSDSV